MITPKAVTDTLHLLGLGIVSYILDPRIQSGTIPLVWETVLVELIKAILL